MDEKKFININKFHKNGGNVNVLCSRRSKIEDTYVKFVEKWGQNLKLIKPHLQTEKMCITAIENHPSALQYVHKQKESMCILAVSINPTCLVYVKEQTPNICYAAIKREYDLANKEYLTTKEREIEGKIRELGFTIRHIRNQTHDLCLLSVMGFAESFCFVNDKTYDICMAAVKRSGIILKYIDKNMVTLELCMEAVKSDPNAIEYADIQNDEMCLIAVRYHGLLLQYVKEQTHEICFMAVQMNGLALEYVKNKTRDICLEAVKNCGYPLEFVDDQDEELCFIAVQDNNILKFRDYAPLAYVYDEYITYDICMEAVKNNNFSIKFVPKHMQTEEMCLLAVTGCGRMLFYVDVQTDEICLAAVKSQCKCKYNGDILKFVHNKTYEICLEAVQ